MLSSLSEAELLALQLDIESRVGLLQQSEPEPEPESELSEPVTYVCVYRSVIRQGFAMSSNEVGVLEAGTEIESLEQRRDDDTGRVRVRFHGGWTSIAASDGQLFLQRKANSESQLQPQPTPQYGP